MAIKRYSRTPVFGLGYRYGTSFAISVIRDNVKNGSIRYDEYVLQENERLDILAGKYYSDSTLGWVIAAASDIGWICQTPPGTALKIPNIDDVSRFIG
jgi:hypothetical protein